MRKFMDPSEIKDYINPSRYFVKKKTCCPWKVVGILVAVSVVIAGIIAFIRFQQEELLFGDDYDEDFEMDEVLYASEADFDE